MMKETVKAFILVKQVEIKKEIPGERWCGTLGDMHRA